MFQLKFTPDFASQADALLAEDSTPNVAPPLEIENSLAGVDSSHPAEATTTRNLWMESLRAVRPMLLKAAALSLASSSCIALSTIAAMRLLQAGQDRGLMWMMSAVYFGLNVLAQAATFRSGLQRRWVSVGVESHLVSRISAKLLRLSAAASARQSSGNLKTLITSDVKNIGQFLDSVARGLFPAAAGVLVTAPLLIVLAGRPGLVGVIVTFMGIPLALVLSRISSRFQAKSQAELDNLTTLAGEWVKNIRLIRYLSWDEAFRRDIHAGVRRFLAPSVRQHFMACLIYGFSMSWWMVTAMGVALVSYAFDFPLDMTAFFGSLWLLTFLNGYFVALPNVIRLYGVAAPSLGRITRLLNEKEQMEHLSEGEPLREDAVPVAILFEDVSFEYPDGKLALEDLSLRIPLSEQLAVIGEIGSGKTTLLKLLCGELPPTRGRVRVEFDKGEVRDLWTRTTYPAYRKHLAYVSQEAFVSSDLFHMNISMHDEAPIGDVMTAAYWAELETDLDALPMGIQQELGEGGVNLSGGQRQRLNLARAFYSQREYMVLDDTMSAVDTRTEVRLMERLVARGKGFVLVTHRTGELFRVARILVMKKGNIVEHGDPHVLAADADSHFNRVLRAYESETVNG
jgi:ABC-type multidrug transport system fused ATPase/permease subunit